LLPGMYAVVEIEGESRRALSIPEEALNTVRQLDSVWVFDDNKGLRRRFVRSGEEKDGRIEILAGLQAGERVVLSTDRVPMQQTDVPLER